VKIELHWFEECPNHHAVRQMLQEALAERGLSVPVVEVDIGDQATAKRYQSPGSPTIRINGRDVEPDYQDPEDYTPRCRLYHTNGGMSGVPDPAWISNALDGAAAD
jgi:hypothetical protein